MSDATADDIEAGDDAPKKGGKKGAIVVVVLALALGGGAFFATSSGMLAGLLGGGDTAGDAHGEDGGNGHDDDHGADHAAADDHGYEHAGPHAGDDGHRPVGPGAAFVTLPPMAASIGAGGAGRQLRMQAVLDVAPEREAEVAALQPRIADSLLGYLRAVDPAVIADPIALLRIRAQMLRRARMIAGDDAVRDLLVTDFVLN